MESDFRELVVWLQSIRNNQRDKAAIRQNLEKPDPDFEAFLEVAEFDRKLADLGLPYFDSVKQLKETNCIGFAESRRRKITMVNGRLSSVPIEPTTFAWVRILSGIERLAQNLVGPSRHGSLLAPDDEAPKLDTVVCQAESAATNTWGGVSPDPLARFAAIMAGERELCERLGADPDSFESIALVLAREMKASPLAIEEMPAGRFIKWLRAVVADRERSPKRTAANGDDAEMPSVDFVCKRLIDELSDPNWWEHDSIARDQFNHLTKNSVKLIESINDDCLRFILEFQRPNSPSGLRGLMVLREYTPMKKFPDGLANGFINRDSGAWCRSANHWERSPGMKKKLIRLIEDWQEWLNRKQTKSFDPCSETMDSEDYKLSEDGMILFRGDEEWPLTSTSSKLIKELLDKYKTKTHYLHESYLQTACEFQGAIRNIVRDGQLTDVVVREIGEHGKYKRGKWGLKIPK